MAKPNKRYHARYTLAIRDLRKAAVAFGGVARAFHDGAASDIAFANAEGELQLAAETYADAKRAYLGTLKA